MRSSDKRWDWGVALGRAAGPAIGAGAAGAIAAGLVTGGLGAPLGGAIAGGGAFVGSFLGSVFGHWADDLPSARETFRSGLLFTTVVSGFLGLPCFLLAAPGIATAGRSDVILATLGGVIGFLSAAGASLVDDWRARQERRYLSS